MSRQLKAGTGSKWLGGQRAQGQGPARDNAGNATPDNAHQVSFCFAYSKLQVVLVVLDLPAFKTSVVELGFQQVHKLGEFFARTCLDSCIHFLGFKLARVFKLEMLSFDEMLGLGQTNLWKYSFMVYCVWNSVFGLVGVLIEMNC